MHVTQQQVAETAKRLAEEEARIAELHAQLREIALAAYVRPPADELALAMGDESPTVAAKRKVLLRELAEAGIAPDVADRFRCPIGLAIGQNQPGEIAISVAAELIQVRDSLAVSAV